MVTTANLQNGQTEFSQKRNFFWSAKNIAPRLRLWLHPAVPEQTQTTTSAATRCRLQIFYSGRVQGVGFRHTARSVAAGFEVNGIVRNLPDGRVELIVEGEESELEAFRKAIGGAGLAGFIRDEKVTWGEVKNKFRGFEIVR
jgi:acylphosphatase